MPPLGTDLLITKNLVSNVNQWLLTPTARENTCLGMCESGYSNKKTSNYYKSR